MITMAGKTPQSRNRLQLTLSTDMRIAVEHLARERGIPASSVATMLLRGALDRTINSGPVQQLIKQHVAQRTRQEWEVDTTSNYAIETQWAKERSETTTTQS